MSIFYRQYKNMDTAGVCNVWNQSGYAGSWGNPFAILNFDLFVTGNFYFDPRDLIVAVDPEGNRGANPMRDGEIIGFIHGGYGPNADRATPNREEGHIAMLAVKKGAWEEEVRARLLLEMEKHFAQMGIRRVYFGAVYPYAPFYMGLLSGCELNGIPENDFDLSTFLPKKGYISVERFHRMRLPVKATLTPLAFNLNTRANKTQIIKSLDKNQSLELQPVPDLWDRRFNAPMELIDYLLINKQTKQFIARLRLRKLERNAETTLYGIHRLYVLEEFRRQGYAKILLRAVLAELLRQGKNIQVELQVSENNVNMLALSKFMNFDAVSTGNVYRRDLSDDFLEKNQN